MRVLLVDDEPRSIEALVEELQEQQVFEHEICTFGEVQDRIRRFLPGAIVLDLLQTLADSSQELRGDRNFDHIWDERFCPVVVYSAEPSHLEHPEHPFIRKIQKGSGSEVEVVEALLELRPSVEAMELCSRETDQALQRALRDVASALHDQQPEVIVRAVRRQLAARIDVSRNEAETLDPSELYIHPPMGTSLSCGDILRNKEERTEDPTAYAVVLTPSCDLVATTSRSAKVSSALVARCRPLSALVDALNPEGKQLSRNVKNKIPKVLTSGVYEGLLVLPKFSNLIPQMVADFRDLAHVPLSQVELTVSQVSGAEEAKFVRVASIDSPFREAVTWGYLQTAGRPGLPNRNTGLWMEEILQELEG